MYNTRPFNLFVLPCLLVLAFSSVSYAQATRTWVSGVGDDANPCSRTAPCKTFAGAISKTAAGGEINALDPGGYGAVTITKAITIDGGETFASILAAGTNGIVVNAGVGDVVVIKNVSINGAGSGLNGIRFLAGAALHVENCTISNFTNLGIDFVPTTSSAFAVTDTIIRGAVAGGILVKPSGAGSARVSINGLRMERNTYGIRAESNSTLTVSNSVASNNTNNGFLAVSTTAAVELNLENCVASNNGTNGIHSVGSQATVRISNCTVTNNNRGLTPLNSGSIISFGNNRIAGNTTADGTPTGTAGQQ